MIVSTHTIFVDVASDLGQGVADSWVRAKNVVVLGGVPLLEAGQLGGDSLEEADDNTNYHQEPVSMSSMPDIRTRPAVTRKSLLK